MEAFQLATAKQSQLDTQLRKSRSPSFSTHVSSVIIDANTRLSNAPHPHESSNTASSPQHQPQVTQVLQSLVDRQQNFATLVRTQTPPPRCFGPVSAGEREPRGDDLAKSEERVQREGSVRSKSPASDETWTDEEAATPIDEVPGGWKLPGSKAKSVAKLTSEGADKLV